MVEKWNFIFFYREKFSYGILNHKNFIINNQSEKNLNKQTKNNRKEIKSSSLENKKMLLTSKGLEKIEKKTLLNVPINLINKTAIASKSSAINQKKLNEMNYFSRNTERKPIKSTLPSIRKPSNSIHV